MDFSSYLTSQDFPSMRYCYVKAMLENPINHSVYKYLFNSKQAYLLYIIYNINLFSVFLSYKIACIFCVGYVFHLK